MKENYLIKVVGTQLADGEENSVELTTRGTFARRGKNYYICYKETAASGFEGCTTIVKLDDAGRVSMTRQGPQHSELIIDPTQRHLCHYDTGHGSLTLGIAADQIIADLTDEGGELQFSYDLDVNCSVFSRNKVKISVREVQ